MDPDISLNFAGSMSEKDSISTKKHMNSTMRSANVTIHGGALLRGGSCSGAIMVLRSGDALFFGPPRLRQVVLQQVAHHARVLAVLNAHDGVDDQRLREPLVCAAQREFVGERDGDEVR